MVNSAHMANNPLGINVDDKSYGDNTCLNYFQSDILKVKVPIIIIINNQNYKENVSNISTLFSLIRKTSNKKASVVMVKAENDYSFY